MNKNETLESILKRCRNKNANILLLGHRLNTILGTNHLCGRYNPAKFTGRYPVGIDVQSRFLKRP